MSDTIRFWSHGVSIIPQYSQAFTNTNNGLIMERADWGTKVTQDAGTSNWFHFPLTSVGPFGSEGIPSLNGFFFLVDINQDAVINRMHLTMIGSVKDPVKIVDQSVDFTNQSKHFNFDLKKTLIVGALVLSLRADFRTRSGQIIFKAAGTNMFEA